MKTSFKQIQQRLQQRELLHSYKRKVYNLRRIVAGDTSALDSFTMGSQDPALELWKDTESEYPDLLVTEVEEGFTNHLIKALKVLTQRIAFQAPEAEVDDLDPIQSAYISAYLQDRFKKGNANRHMEAVLWEALVGGLGWAICGIDHGIPTVRKADMIDCIWDITEIPEEAAWFAHAVTKSKWRWKEEYDIDVGKEEDEPVELWQYFDRIGDQGKWVITDGEKDLMNEVFPLPDWNIVPLSMFRVPSVRLPIGIVEMALPNYKAAVEGERAWRETIKRMPSWIAAQKGAISPDEMQQFEDGEIGAVIELDNIQGVVTMPGGNIQPTAMEWINSNIQQIIEQAGVNPYAYGGKVEGIQYAAEVNAIEGNADLTTSWAARAYALAWQRVATVMLKIGAMFDEEEFTTVMNGARLELGPQDPPWQYLDASASVVVRESSVIFKPKQQAIMDSINDLTIAQQMAPFFPNAVKMSYQGYLRAKGEKNPDAWLEMPIAPAGVGTPFPDASQQGSASQNA